MKEFEHRVRPRILKEFESDDQSLFARIVFNNYLEEPFEVIFQDFSVNPEGDGDTSWFNDYMKAYQFVVTKIQCHELPCY